MRYSQLFTSTLREIPRDVESGNHELLVRAGFIRQLTSGVFYLLPLGVRVLHKITQIVREEMNRIGGQEVLMPILQPRDIWEQRPDPGMPSRAERYGLVLFGVRDRRERAMVLAPTHEEVSTLLAKEFVHSYRDFPQMLYQIQVKLRDEARPRGGMLRLREFIMKDLYSFDADQEGLEGSFSRIREAYCAILRRCGLNFVVAQADSGAIGGKDSLEFLALTEAGEDDVLLCNRCGYAANREKAEFIRSSLPDEPEQALEEVYTPDCTAIRDLAAYLTVSETKTMKAVCYVAGGRMILVVLRGDLEVNEIKLANTLAEADVHTTDLRLATAEELAQEGIVAGYTSPLDKDEHMLIIADPSLRQGKNFVAGANKMHYHIRHVNYPRDYRVDIWADIASAYDGATCVQCGGTLDIVRGSEMGHIFKLGTLYSKMFEATYLDAEGAVRPIQMGCYGLGISRLIGVIVEQWHDERGIAWPFGVAPYHVALVGLDKEKGESGAIAEKLYADLCAAGVEVLYDDRSESAGVKFHDADLIGLPLRVVISKRSLKNGGVELKRRTQAESCIVSLEEAVQTIQVEIQKGPG
jgi:prolyl-tRNA synthetase